jgi:hypothetical protein
LQRSATDRGPSRPQTRHHRLLGRLARASARRCSTAILMCRGNLTAALGASECPEEHATADCRCPSSAGPWHIAAPDVCGGTSAVGESRHRIPGASVGQPTEPCLGKCATCGPLYHPERTQAALERDLALQRAREFGRGDLAELLEAGEISAGVLSIACAP